MSIGLILGVANSYTREGAHFARQYLFAINVALKEAGLEPYVEPAGEVSARGRSTIDGGGGEAFGGVGELAAADFDGVWKATVPQPPGFFAGLRGAVARPAAAPTTKSHLGLLAVNPYRVAFLPADFPAPLRTEHEEPLGGVPHLIWFGSAPRLLKELRDVAWKLKIPLGENGELSDEIVDKLNDGEPLSEGDDTSRQSAWFQLHEGALAAVKHGMALSLAG